MYKIEINWDFRSPSLGILTGEVKIGQLSMGMLQDKGFPVKKERGSRGYKQNPAVFERCKPLVDLMVDAYYDGMLMSESSYLWFDNCSKHNRNITINMFD